MPALHVPATRLDDLRQVLADAAGCPPAAIDLETLVRSAPALRTLSPLTLERKLDTFASSLRISSRLAARIYMGSPRYCLGRPSTLIENIKSSAMALGIPLRVYLRWVVSVHSLALVTSAKAVERRDGLVAAFGILPKDLRKVLRRCPQLLTANPDRLRIKATNLITALQLTEPAFRRMITQRPMLLLRTPATLNAKLTGLQLSLGISPEVVRHICLKRPVLLQLTPAHLVTRLADIAAALDVETAAVRWAALRQPLLFTTTAPHVRATCVANAKLFGIATKTYVLAALQCPHLFHMAAATLRPKISVLREIAEALGHPLDARRSLTTFPMAYTYSLARLRDRLILAQKGLGPASLSNLLTMAEVKAAGLRRGAS